MCISGASSFPPNEWERKLTDRTRFWKYVGHTDYGGACVNYFTKRIVSESVGQLRSSSTLKLYRSKWMRFLILSRVTTLLSTILWLNYSLPPTSCLRILMRSSKCVQPGTLMRIKRRFLWWRWNPRNFGLVHVCERGFIYRCPYALKVLGMLQLAFMSYSNITSRLNNGYPLIPSFGVDTGRHGMFMCMIVYSSFTLAWHVFV